MRITQLIEAKFTVVSTRLGVTDRGEKNNSKKKKLPGKKRYPWLNISPTFYLSTGMVCTQLGYVIF